MATEPGGREGQAGQHVVPGRGEPGSQADQTGGGRAQGVGVAGRHGSGDPVQAGGDPSGHRGGERIGTGVGLRPARRAGPAR
ncbi:MAG: hypothetical protein QM804_12210 [Propionicimonas sp.]